jgi:hypothetical protein
MLMPLPHLSQTDLETILSDHIMDASDGEILRSVAKYLQNLRIPDTVDQESWLLLQMRWPPRVVEAQRRHRLVPFFGAGVSVGSGLPSWNKLLSQHFGLQKEVIEDVDLTTDALTLAELASQKTGPEAVQSILRKTFGKGYKPAASHFLLAALRCPIYVTTNYDSLFEKAWEALNEKHSLLVITNDLDWAKHAVELEQLRKNGKTSVLFKIHGSADREDELMILSRRDYRHHYRNNKQFFHEVTSLLRKSHVLFLGFSHRDPEVTRLVEDAIYAFEHSRGPNGEVDSSSQPNLYSLQFDMRSHSPEAFAARGIVALQPPSAMVDIVDARSATLCVALSDLVVACDRDTHSVVSLDSKLTSVVTDISKDLSRALKVLKSREKEVIRFLSNDDPDVAPAPAGTCLDGSATQIGPLAGQGVYLLNDLGRVRALDTPHGISSDTRRSATDFSRRPYFREAKTFQRGFVSNSARSVFNQHSTIFLCLPLIAKQRFLGLLFSAAQVGVWETPLRHAKDCWMSGNLDFVLIDANGVLLLPPRDEFQPKPYIEKGNDPNANLGYAYDRLLELSRRDRLVIHLADNIVPLAQDDDFKSFSPDLRSYSVVTEIPNTSWKLALSRRMIKR